MKGRPGMVAYCGYSGDSNQEDHGLRVIQAEFRRSHLKK
jgi:hypothetical protein